MTGVSTEVLSRPGDGWLSGYSAVVTGGASGIGLAVVERYIAEGALVAVLDRNVDPARALADEQPDRVLLVEGDVTHYADSVAAVDAAIETYGRLDVFVGNAGIFDFFMPLEKYEPEALGSTFDEIFAINVKGYLNGALASASALRSTKGAMIFTSSIAAFHPSCAGIVYTAAKHAIVGIVRQLAHELAPDVRVNSVAPGGTLTPLSGSRALDQSQRSILDVPGVDEMIAASVPLGFAQQPDDHAGLYALLASRENAKAVTGQVFVSDGGVGVRKV